MKGILGLVLAVVVIFGAVPFARGLGAPASPPGVKAADWIALGDAAGFVVAHDSPQAGATRTPAGTVRGYFMVRRSNTWLRVDADAGFDVHKAVMAN